MSQPARPSARLRALVTNDDGVDSEGLHALAEAATQWGMDVTVVAPSWDASGASASMTAVASDGKVAMQKVRGPESGGVVFGVHGPPAFIVRAAMYGAFGPAPDVVLSGINRGLNTGRAILHSGTVGAALTAATYGRSGLALSAEVGDDEDWRRASRVAGAALSWLIGTPDATVLNVNVPAVPGDLRGVRATSLAESGTVQASVTDASGAFVPVTFGDGDHDPAPGTDAAALADGWVSVTAIRAVAEDDSFDLVATIQEAGSGVAESDGCSRFADQEGEGLFEVEIDGGGGVGGVAHREVGS
jgi:5'-nucleotidase